MTLIWGAEKEAKAIPHLTARLASRFNSLRLFLDSESESEKKEESCGSGVRETTHGKEHQGQEHGREHQGRILEFDCGKRRVESA